MKAKHGYVEEQDVEKQMPQEKQIIPEKTEEIKEAIVTIKTKEELSTELNELREAAKKLESEIEELGKKEEYVEADKKQGEFDALQTKLKAIEVELEKAPSQAAATLPPPDNAAEKAATHEEQPNK